MPIVRYDPLSMMNQLQEELNRAFSRAIPADEDNGSIATSDWAPAVDIKEDDKAFVLHADVPGVDPKDIEVSMEKGTLTIRGERRAGSDEDKAGYKRIERVRGTFYRRFALPDSADPEKITARGENGVLVVTIPKAEKVQPRRISVET